MESIASVNGVEIAYETFGDPGDETMLLIMGLGVQMLGWDERFCRGLAGRGYRVVRFDNRDVGHSTKVEGGPRPDVMAAITNKVRYANAVPASRPMIRPELLADTNIFPTPAQMATFFTIGPVPQMAERQRTRMWARFKAGH